MVLSGPVGIGAGTLADDDVIQIDVILNGTGGTHADDLLYAEEVEQLVGVDADGGHSHAGSHDGNLDALVVAGVTVDTTNIVYQNGIFKESLCNKFGAQGIAGHQNGLAEADLILNIDMGSNREVGHNQFLLSKFHHQPDPWRS